MLKRIGPKGDTVHNISTSVYFLHGVLSLSSNTGREWRGCEGPPRRGLKKLVVFKNYKIWSKTQAGVCPSDVSTYSRCWARSPIGHGLAHGPLRAQLTLVKWARSHGAIAAASRPHACGAWCWVCFGRTSPLKAQVWPAHFSWLPGLCTEDRTPCTEFIPPASPSFWRAVYFEELYHKNVGKTGPMHLLGGTTNHVAFRQGAGSGGTRCHSQYRK